MTDLNPVDAMTNPYRAMCAELIERLEWFIAEDETNENDPGNQYWLTGKQAGIDSVARARALLAQPGPPELTRDELLRCAKIATPDYSNHWGRELEMMRAAITADRARALLAQPVAVSERWPEFSDCDPQERVWAWNPVLDHWKLSRISRSHTHWLPANALPIPRGHQ